MHTVRFHSPQTLQMATRHARLSDQDGIRERIRRVISERAGGKQNQLAETAKIQNSKLSNILTGKDSVTRQHLLKIEDATGARVAWLEAGVEPVYHAPGKAPARPTPAKEGELLRAFVAGHGGPSELANRLGVTRATVSGYFTSTLLNDRKKIEIARAFNVSVNELFNNNSSTNSVNNPEISVEQPIHVHITKDVIRIFMVPAKGRAGFQLDSLTHAVLTENNSVEIPQSWIKRDEKHVIFEINGDAMQNTLQAGHQALAYAVNPNDWPYARGIVAIKFRDQFLIKRIEDNGLLLPNGLLTLTSDNPISGGTFRVPSEEIIEVWQLIRNLGGPL